MCEDVCAAANTAVGSGRPSPRTSAAERERTRKGARRECAAGGGRHVATVSRCRRQLKFERRLGQLARAHHRTPTSFPASRATSTDGRGATSISDYGTRRGLTF
ncbi:hypothetical protein MRX96_005403 [Rhipicephalus microplus]